MPDKKEQYGYRCIFCGVEKAELPATWLKMNLATICDQCTSHLNIDIIHEPVPCTIVEARRDPDDPKRTIITVDAAFIPDTIIGNRANITVKFSVDEDS